MKMRLPRFLSALCTPLLLLGYSFNVSLGNQEESTFVSDTEDSWRASKSMSVNGRTTSVSIHVEGQVQFKDGMIQSWEPGARVSIKSQRGSRVREALFSEVEGEWHLEVKRKGRFEVAELKQQPWVEEALSELTIAEPIELEVVSEAELVRLPEEGDGVLSVLDTVGSLSFDSTRTDVLNKVACLPELSSPAQLKVITLVFDELDFSSNKMKVLLTLINHPDFSSSAVKQLSARLHDLTFESDRRKIQSAMLEALSRT